MRVLKPFQAPHSYTFVDPDTKRQFRQRSEALLVKEIISYRSQNRLPPIAHLELVLQNYWCSLPENVGKCKPFKLKLGLLEIMHGGIAIVKNFYYGEENMVSQQEAETRAEICVHANNGKACPENIFPDKGPFLKYAERIALASTKGRTTQLDSKLGNCGACGCVLKAKVHFKGPFELEDEQLEKMPAYCWQKAAYEKEKGLK